MNRILDMSIEKTEAGWRLYVPIKTGHIELTVPAANDEMNRFLETAYNTPLRRFGEDLRSVDAALRRSRWDSVARP